MEEQGFFKQVIKHYQAFHLYDLYYYVIIIYSLPILSFLLFILDQMFLNKTEMLFWIIFLVSLAPCALIGIVLSILGLKKGMKKKNKPNIIIGICFLILGIAGVMGGILNIALIYLVVS